MENIIFFCAHNDDQIIGGGGTIAKYTSEGKNVTTVVFSHGEMSQFWMKPKHIIETRIKELKEADKILGGNALVFLDLSEGKFMEQYKERNIEKDLINLIEEEKPSKIFCHSLNDPHPDHVSVYKLVNMVLDKCDYKGDVYLYDVWTPVSLKKRNEPKMFVDIGQTLSTKIKAFKVHRSQRLVLFALLWKVYLQAFLNGVDFNCKYAEVFLKLR